jgi:very-short-patch-repair endonuclease
MSYTTNRVLIQKARDLRKNMTLPEKILWSRLRSKKIKGYKFRRQYPVYDYIVDFYCDEFKLIVEVDGDIHNIAENKEYDDKREHILKINGYQILRFTNYEIETNVNSVTQRIRTFIDSKLYHSVDEQ